MERMFQMQKLGKMHRGKANIMREEFLGSNLGLNALSYYESYKWLMFKYKKVSDSIGGSYNLLFYPATTLLPFAIELAFKVRIGQQYNQNGIYKWHQLGDLFQKLDKKTQNAIIERTIDFYNIKATKLSSEEMIKLIDFESLLKENSNRFLEMRYFHEGNVKGMYDVDFLEALLFALIDDVDDYIKYLNEIIDVQDLEEKKKKLDMIF